MSDYKIVNGKKIRICKYQCGSELVWSDDISGFIETKGGLAHTQERCKQVKESKQTKQDTNGHNDISLELVLAKLRKIGVDINLDLLKNVPVNGDVK